MQHTIQIITKDGYKVILRDTYDKCLEYLMQHPRKICFLQWSHTGFCTFYNPRIKRAVRYLEHRFVDTEITYKHIGV